MATTLYKNRIPVAKMTNDDFQYLSWYFLFVILYTVLIKKYPLIGLIVACIGFFVVVYRMYQKIYAKNGRKLSLYYQCVTIKIVIVFLACFVFFLNMTTNVGSGSLLRLLLMINIAIVAVICIDNPIIHTDNYNNIWLALGLILVSLCAPYITFQNQSYTLKPSWIPVSMFFIISTMLLSYLYHTHPHLRRYRYANQVAVWIPLFFFFFNNAWFESRSVLMVYLLSIL